LLNDFIIPPGIALVAWFWEWLKRWANEVDHVSLVKRIALMIKLTAVETVDKQANSTVKSIRAA
jgi:hypothetical protein